MEILLTELMAAIMYFTCKLLYFIEEGHRPKYLLKSEHFKSGLQYFGKEEKFLRSNFASFPQSFHYMSLTSDVKFRIHL